LAHNDPLLLADSPYRYALEYRSNDEARFPELFKPQVCAHALMKEGDAQAYV
jgi:hypothetical protein